MLGVVYPGIIGKFGGMLGVYNPGIRREGGYLPTLVLGLPTTTLYIPPSSLPVGVPGPVHAVCAR